MRAWGCHDRSTAQPCPLRYRPRWIGINGSRPTATGYQALGDQAQSGTRRCGPRRALEPRRGLRALHTNSRRVSVVAAFDRSLRPAGLESYAGARLPRVIHRHWHRVTDAGRTERVTSRPQNPCTRHPKSVNWRSELPLVSETCQSPASKGTSMRSLDTHIRVDISDERV
jgi:hypothetical protein